MARALRGLILALSLWLVAGSALALTPSDFPQTYDGQLAYCNALAGSGVGGGAAGPCYIKVDNATTAHWMFLSRNNGTYSSNNFPYNGTVPTDRERCLGAPSKSLTSASGSVCVAGCSFGPADDGRSSSHQHINFDGSVSEVFSGTYVPSGDSCSGGPGVPAPVSDPTPPRQLCGGGSCHDVAAGKFCAVNGAGAQVCISDKPPAGQPGGCITAGDTTLCAGAPPPLPPNPPILDPPTQIVSTDQYQDKTGTTVTNSTVNNYNTKGGQPNSGAGADDVTPPEKGDDPSGDKTSASGGGNCNTPPICEGAAATCMVVTQTWLLRCKGDDGGSSNDADTTVPGLEGIGEGPGEGFHRTETLLDKLDTGGLGGGGQCPNLLVLDLDQYGIHLDGNNSTWCSILDKAGWMLMFIAAFISLRILSEK